MEKNDPAILFIKPGAISDVDKIVLMDAGIIVIEIDDPASVKFTRATVDLPQGDLMTAAAKAIKHSKASTEKFGELMANLFVSKP